MSLERRLGVVEESLHNVELAVAEQGRLLAKHGAAVKQLEDQANDLPAAFRVSIDSLWDNQRVLADGLEFTAWKIDKLLHVLNPEDYADPDVVETIDGEKNGDGSEAAPDTAEDPRPREQEGASAVPEVRDGLSD